MFMPNAYGAPETSAFTLAEKLKTNEPFLLLDVREFHEVSRVHLDTAQTSVVPLSRLARKQLDALPVEAQNRDAEIIVLCHHGVRSAQVTAWLLHNGWTNVVSLSGGIDAYAREIDPTIGFY